MATDKIVDPNRGVRNVLIIMGAVVWLTGLLPVFWSGSLAENLLMYSVFFLVVLSVMIFARISYPKVVLDHEGVTVTFFRKKSYLWKDIIEAGRYHSDRKSPAARYFNLVLILPGGSPKRPGKDRGYLLRKPFQKVSLPNERHILDFIRARYGQLDFDDYDQVSEFDKRIHHLDQTK